VALRRAAARLGLGLGMIALAVGLAVFGGILCLWAGYELLAASIGQTLAALVIGVVAIAIAGVLLWAARKLTN
jgi:hypothetical protein